MIKNHRNLSRLATAAAVSLVAVCAQSCASYFSVTTIEPKRTFVLGEGEHPAYQANVRNVGLFDVDVATITRGGISVPLGTLKPGASAEYRVNPNTAVFFKNSALLAASVKIDIFSTFFPSMGYKDNKDNAPENAQDSTSGSASRSAPRSASGATPERK